ncbi:unknown [Sutterella sp. CAG:351]|nr:unknown [Sutterella sp. CAG:351]
MLSAMGRISSGNDAGTPFTQGMSSVSVIRHAASSVIPRSFGARAASERRLPPQSGHASNFRNFSTRFIPLSSFTLASAFSTVFTAL